MVSRRRFWLVLAAVLAIFVGRRPDAFFNPQFWAEDFVFLVDAQNDGLATFFRPMAGYLHLLPRTIAYLGHFLDPAWQPPLYVGASVAVALAVVAACLSERHDLPAKVWLALAVALVPTSGEVYFNPTNLQWIAALGLLLTWLKRDPASAGDWAVDLGFLVFAGLSGPFSLFAAPLFLWRLWARKSRASAMLAVVIAAAAAVQLWFALHEQRELDTTSPFRGYNLLAVISYRLAASLFFGVGFKAVWGPGATVAAGVLVAGLLGYGIWRLDGGRWRIAGLFIFVALLLIPTEIRVRLDQWTMGDIDNGDRYWVIPKIVVLWSMGIVAARSGVRWLRWTAVGLIVTGVVLNLPRFHFAPYRDYHWYALCPAIRRGEDVQVTINPEGTFGYSRREQK